MLKIKMKHLLSYIIMLLTVSLPCYGQIDAVDSVLMVAIHAIDSVERDKMLAAGKDNFIDEYQKRTIDHERKYDIDGIQHIIRGTVLTSTDRHFREHKGRFRERGSEIGEYGIALLPYAATWIMRASGVKSMSSTNRLLMSNALSFAISSGISLSLKNAIKEDRPNGKDDNSLPSGHCSMAFTAATIIHREYGHISPWFTIGGYASATAVQMLRVRHNAHWLNDTFLGAGIGMMSTNLAYFITDKALGGKGINPPRQTMNDIYRRMKFIDQPTTLSLITCIETSSNNIKDECYELANNFNGKLYLKTGSTFSTGVECNCFINPYLGFDGMLRLASCQTMAEAVSTTDKCPELYGCNIDMYHGDLGIKGSYPIGNVMRVSARAYGGYRLTKSANIINAENYTTFAKIKSDNCAEVGGGIAVDLFKEHNKHMFGFYVDFNHSFSELFKNRWCIGSSYRILL